MTAIEIRRGIERRRIVAVAISVALHCLIFAALIRQSPPLILKQRSVMLGNHGASVAIIAIPSDLILPSLPESHSTFHAPPVKKKTLKTKLPPRPKANEETSGASLQAARAGSPHGSQSYGLSTGHELKPALPIVGGRPRLAPADLPGGVQGDVIVEITISEQGKVVEKKVIQSVAPEVDQKVLAALEYWQFTPATQDGRAIASQQYVYFHFPS